MRSGFYRKLAIATCTLLAAALGMVAIRSTFWETWRTEHEVKLANGSTVHVVSSGSQRRYIGLRHGPDFWGGHPLHKIRFSNGEIQYGWEGAPIPIVLDWHLGDPVLVVFDRETDFKHITFRHFRHRAGDWEELPMAQFPPTLAKQNLWLSADDEDLLAEWDPDSFWFQHSLTARMWHCITTGQQYWEAEREAIKPDFLRKFMARHFSTATRQPGV